MASSLPPGGGIPGLSQFPPTPPTTPPGSPALGPAAGPAQPPVPSPFGPPPGPEGVGAPPAGGLGGPEGGPKPGGDKQAFSGQAPKFSGEGELPKECGAKLNKVG